MSSNKISTSYRLPHTYRSRNTFPRPINNDKRKALYCNRHRYLFAVDLTLPARVSRLVSFFCLSASLSFCSRFLFPFPSLPLSLSFLRQVSLCSSNSRLVQRALWRARTAVASDPSPKIDCEISPSTP